jgi:DNA-binding NtrC family response regulator
MGEATPSDPHATAKARILFVDDEPHILTAIQRQLYKERRRWDMVFALGGQHGLDEIRTRCFTVVVSDFRMPHVDGVTLLCEVVARCPRAVPIMLSGDAEADVVSLEVPALRQLLIKPCDAATLRDAIERAIDAASAAG